MVMKMPMKRKATSLMGPKLNALRVWMDFDVRKKEVGARQEHRADDHDQEKDIEGALKAPGVGLLDLALDAWRGALERAPVIDIKHGEEGAEGEKPFGDDMVEQPEKRYAAQVTEEERWVADGREGAADVGDDKDEENDVEGADADFIHPDVRPDEDHGGAGGADEVSQYAADKQEEDVLKRSGLALDVEMDAPGDHEQRPDQGNKRNIFVRGVEDAVAATGDLEEIKSGNEGRQDDGDVGVVVFPRVFDPGRRQRHHGDQQQDQPEGQDEKGIDVGVNGGQGHGKVHGGQSHAKGKSREFDSKRQGLKRSCKGCFYRPGEVLFPRLKEKPLLL
jgi:hypothetical protein